MLQRKILYKYHLKHLYLRDELWSNNGNEYTSVVRFASAKKVVVIMISSYNKL